MNAILIFYESKKLRLSAREAVLFYKANGYISIDYFFKDEDGKWTLYGGTGTKSEWMPFRTAVSSFLWQVHARRIRRFHLLTQIKDFTRTAITGTVYPWERQRRNP